MSTCSCEQKANGLDTSEQDVLLLHSRLIGLGLIIFCSSPTIFHCMPLSTCTGKLEKMLWLTVSGKTQCCLFWSFHFITRAAKWDSLCFPVLCATFCWARKSISKEESDQGRAFKTLQCIVLAPLITSELVTTAWTYKICVLTLQIILSASEVATSAAVDVKARYVLLHLVKMCYYLKALQWVSTCSKKPAEPSLLSAGMNANQE